MSKETELNETVKKTIEERLAVLKQKSEELTTRQIALGDELATVNANLKKVQTEIDDLNAFLAGEPSA